MALQVTLMTEPDIDGAIDTIQQAFAEDPYNKWIYNDRSKVQIPSSHALSNFDKPTRNSSPPFEIGYL
jgi:hypothetical protein